MSTHSHMFIQGYLLIHVHTLTEMTHICACVLSHFSCVQLFVTLWSVACQIPLSMRFSRQEYLSGFLSPEDLPDPGIEPMSFHLLHWKAVSLPLAPLGKPTNHTHTHTHTHTQGYYSKWILHIQRLTLSTEIPQCPRGPSCDSHWSAASRCCRTELTGSQLGQGRWWAGALVQRLFATCHRSSFNILTLDSSTPMHTCWMSALCTLTLAHLSSSSHMYSFMSPLVRQGLTTPWHKIACCQSPWNPCSHTNWHSQTPECTNRHAHISFLLMCMAPKHKVQTFPQVSATSQQDVCPSVLSQFPQHKDLRIKGMMLRAWKEVCLPLGRI